MAYLSFSLSVTAVQEIIVDGRNEAMSSAVIAYFWKSNIQVLHATTSNAEGWFSLSVDWEKELLRIFFLGYQDVEIADESSEL
ncbi:hypothetical protein ACIXMS_08965 [Bacteroides fragilis]